jgi:membrane associated rhomboid family serine protease
MAQFALGKFNIDLGESLGLHYWQSPKFRWWQLITHIFMHGDARDVQMTLLHLISNMFPLWMFGSTLENIWGLKRFLIFYMVCGLGAAFCHLGVLTYEFTTFHNAFVHYQQAGTFVEFAQFVRHNNLSDNSYFSHFVQFWQQNPGCQDCFGESVKAINLQYSSMINEATVGASGAVFGILFAFGYLFPNTLLYLYFAIPIKAKWFVGAYAVFELYSGIRNTAGDNIAHFAHLGGMLFAFILLSIWQSKNRNQFY